MSVVAEVRVSAEEFDLGRLFEAGAGPDAVVELETLVPVGERTVSYVWVLVDRVEELLATVGESPKVDRARVVDEFEEQSLIAFDWSPEEDPLFGDALRTGVAVLGARGREGTWVFELRFDDHAELGAFRERCAAADVNLDVDRLYNPTAPRTDLRFGVTGPQQEALALAVDRGYYDVPRRCTTAELAAEFGISDQAVSERLRRGIATLVEHTLGSETAGRP